jgi:hypothetical protein
MGGAHPSKPSGRWTLFGKDITRNENVLVDIGSSENRPSQKQPSPRNPTPPASEAAASSSHYELPPRQDDHGTYVMGTVGIPQKTMDAVSLKRPLSPSPSAMTAVRSSPSRDSPTPKRARGDGNDGPSVIPRNSFQSGEAISQNPSCSAPDSAGDPGAPLVLAGSSRGPFVPSEGGENVMLRDGDGDGDLFMSEGWRERWCRCPDVSSQSSM